ncbi:isochorismatase family protein [Agrococcus sp. ARC_14]|uniref:isochorismatase family protein n=1 Tax=Agrococcus sp. ARC_14 TaxID=2919927 RepID=UPI001F06A455|nr:isochorismatase family protein [Agrococcus sp. ARC_14]MCH1883913.1 isochorismatase family protein [Agrococcus sp. ARC_14]
MTLFETDKSALVIIDMQGAVRRHAAAPHDADTVITRVASLVDAAREGGALVVYVRTSFLPDESDSLTLVKRVDVERRAPHRWDGWDQLVDEMQPLPTEPVVIKRSWNAFYGSDLDLQLRRHGIETVVMCGISTSFGVEGTARSAYDHGYELVFVEDAMASQTTEQHEFAVREVFPQIGRVRDVAAVTETFRASAQTAA